ncbi:hypothetical protein [Streptomyces sp. NPDC020330]|uniref:hypothetical protein n=1 Tax=unclassified Streptomyces TaxID=2593676 RepID=UPI0037874F4B
MRRRGDGSIHLRRKGTVVFGWAAILSLCPVLVLFGLADVEKYGFRGVGVLWVTGFVSAMIIRGTIRPRVILEPDGSIRNIGPFLEMVAFRDEGLSVTCENNGLMIVCADGEQGAWSFSQSLLGGRSARNARKFIGTWLKEERKCSSGRAVAGRRGRVHVGLVDVFLLVAPLAAPVLMKL